MLLREKDGTRQNTVVNDIFSYNIVVEIINYNEDPEHRTVEECRYRNDWSKWKDAIQAKLDSLSKLEVLDL